MRARTNAPGRIGRSGFTLVELLTVIIIIGLLASILLPTVTSAIKSGYLAKTMGQSANLSVGAENYKQDHGGFYPGQDYTNWSGYTGSQVLAASVFDYVVPGTTPFSKVPLADPDPKGKYAACKDEYLVSLQNKPNTLSDLFPKGKEMAFVYYPDRGGTFTEADNTPYTSVAGASGGVFSTFTQDARFSAPVNKGRFILLAPGSDRKYFTADDIRNW